MPPLDTIYTADEAAERLRLTKRAVLKLGRDLGACSRVGREYLFSEADLLAIWQAMRVELPPHPTAGTMRLNLAVGRGMTPQLAKAIEDLEAKKKTKGRR